MQTAITWLQSQTKDLRRYRKTFAAFCMLGLAVAIFGNFAPELRALRWHSRNGDFEHVGGLKVPIDRLAWAEENPGFITILKFPGGARRLFVHRQSIIGIVMMPWAPAYASDLKKGRAMWHEANLRNGASYLASRDVVMAGYPMGCDEYRNRKGGVKSTCIGLSAAAHFDGTENELPGFYSLIASVQKAN
jgi:hypothetical protein